ncbi:glycosyl hydrolase 108 family protein [Legionella sp. CNM-4043-24]|uniref:glycosyl hydrolase 108 family protein n=1 Tax=Legionella sp. CNM-4043-24 TaxID=3421646 RepID=UPI00403B2F64
MTQIFTGSGLGALGSSIGQLGSFGPKGSAALGQGGASVSVNAANGNLVLGQADGFLADSGMGLDLFQSYNAQGGDGRWRFNLDTRLQVPARANVPGSVVSRVDEDGHVSGFHYDERQGAYLADDGGLARLVYADGSWTYQNGSAGTYQVYDAAGLLQYIRDRDGHAFSLNYEQGRLSSIVDASGRQNITWVFRDGLLREVVTRSDGEIVHRLRYEYDAAGRVSRAMRELGNGQSYWIRYGYAGSSSLITDIEQSDGSSLHIDYDEEGRVRRLTDGAGCITSWRYERGCTIISNGAGDSWTYFYDEQNRLTGIDGPEGYRIRYEYEGLYLCSVVEGSQRWRFTWSDSGDCLSIEYPDGALIRRCYDQEHRLLSETRSHVPDEQHQTVRTETRRFVYDERGHLRFEIQADGVVSEYRYNAEGLCVSKRIWLKSVYDILSLPDEQSPSLEQLTLWTTCQNPQAIQLTEYCYDWRGELTEERRYTAIDAEGGGIETTDTQITRCRYDAAGRLIEKSTPGSGGLNSTWYTYDDLGRLILVMDSQGHTQSIEYDDAHQRIIKTDAHGVQRIELYDRRGLLLSVHTLTDEHDFGTVSYCYDDSGRLTAETGVDGRTALVFYDRLGRIKARINAAGEVTEYRYDLNGHVIQTHQLATHLNTRAINLEALPDWSAIRPAYSTQDRITQVIYNEYQQIAFEIDASGAVTAWEYDGQNRVAAKRVYAERLEDYEAGTLLSADDISLKPGNDDRIIRYYYDACGRLQGEINGEGAVTEYQYDARGLLTQTRRLYQRARKDLNGDWSHDVPCGDSGDLISLSLYNAAGLKTADLDAQGFLTEYCYDAAGLLVERIAFETAVQYPLQEPLSLGEIRPHSGGNDRRTLYRYNDLHQLIEEETQSGLKTSYTWNDQGLLSSKTRTDTRQQKQRAERYRYDALGRLIQSLNAEGVALLAETDASDSGLTEAVWRNYSIRFEYDLAGRLLQKTSPGQEYERYYYGEDGLLLYTLNAAGGITETRHNAFQQPETRIRYHAVWKGTDIPSLDALRDFLETAADPAHDEVSHYEYNELGLLISKREGTAGLITLDYNAFAEVAVKKSWHDGHVSLTTEYQYDHQGLLLGESREDDGHIHQTQSFAYDAFGRLKTATDARNGVTSYQTNRRGEVTLIEDPLQQRTSTRYDAFGRVLSIEKEGNTERYSYDDQKGTLTLKRQNGATIVTEFNAFGDKISLTDALGNIHLWHYDEQGRLIQVSGPEGSRTDYHYDRSGHLLTEKDASGRLIRYDYDAAGRILSQRIDPDGLNLTSLFTYDGIGRQLSVSLGGRLTQYEYDARGLLISQCIDPQGLNLVTDYEYSDQGLLIRETRHNPGGVDQVQTHTWDALARRLSTTVDPDGLNLVTRFEYDESDNLTGKVNALGQRTQYLYDAGNRLSYSIDPMGGVVSHRYDRTGNELQRVSHARRLPPGNYTDEAAVTGVLEPDAADQYQFYTYDGQGRLILSYDSLGYVTRCSYDLSGNLLEKRAFAVPCSLDALKQGEHPVPKDSTLSRSTRYAWDGLARLRYQISPDGALSEFVYDKAGRVIQEIRYATRLKEGAMKDDYSSANIDACKTRHSDDQITRFAFDHAGRLSGRVSAEGVVSAFRYDAAGQLLEKTEHAQLLTREERERDDFMAAVRVSGNDRHTQSLFDAAGRELYRISPGGSVVERRYDAVGNVLSEISHARLVKVKPYDLGELRTALGTASPSDRLSVFAYDAAGRLQLKTDAMNHETRYDYDDNGNVLTRQEANGACWTYVYDACDRLIETSTPQTTFSVYRNGRYEDETRAIINKNEYDAFGNLTAEIKDVGGLNQCTSYVYDHNNRKTAILYPERAVSTAGSTSTGAREESLRKPVEYLSYNAFGELTARCDPAGNIRRWVYDQAGQVSRSLDARQALTSYEYDAFGNLKRKTLAATPLDLSSESFDGELLQNSQPSDHDRHEDYVYDHDNRLIELKKDSVLSYDARTQTYERGRPASVYRYNAFGELISSSTRINSREFAVTRYGYNHDGLQTSCQDAEGYLTTKSYDAFRQLSGEIQYALRAKPFSGSAFVPTPSNEDRRISCQYDALGRLISKTQHQVRHQRLSQNGTKYEDVTADLKTTWQYDAMGNLIKTTDPLGHSTLSYYNAIGLLTAGIGAETQAGRAATTYRFDALGNLVESHRHANGARNANEDGYQLSAASAADIVQLNLYDACGQLIEQRDGTGAAVFFSYDIQGNIARRWQILTRPDQSHIVQDKRYHYDAENQLIQTATFKAGGQAATEDARYNVFGEVVAKGINGHFSTHIDYDRAGRVWRSNTEGYYRIFVYDLNNNLTQVVMSTNVWDETHHDMGVDLSESSYEQAINYNQDVWRYQLQRQDYEYDALGHLLVQSKDGSSSLLDKQNGRLVDRARQVQVVDRWGNVIAHTNANHYTTYYEYNALDQVIRQIMPEVRVVDEHGIAKQVKPVLRYAYDALGRLIAATDANGHNRTKVLDAEGRVIEEIDALGGRRYKQYNLLDQMSSSRNENGAVTLYTYDKASRLISISTNNSWKGYVYDEAGQLIEQHIQDGGSVKNFYDTQGNLVQRIQSGISSRYEYDDAGHKTAQYDAKGNSQHWYYDEYGHLVRHQDMGGRETIYEYNRNGLILKQHSDHGKNISWLYYSDGQVQEYRDLAQEEVVDFTYDAEGQVLSKDSSRKDFWILETDHYQYDALGRLVQIRRRNPEDSSHSAPDLDHALLSIDYEYDAAGNIRDTRVMTHYGAYERKTHEDYFLYDANNRLRINKGQLINGTIQITTGQGSEIEYDGAGNIISSATWKAGSRQEYQYEYNEDNLLTGIKKNHRDLQKKYYDKAGNVVDEYDYDTRGNKSQHNQMIYEAGRLVASIGRGADEDKNLSRNDYAYDEAGNLISLTTRVFDQGKSKGYIQTHRYEYALWDSYQQSRDDATLEIEGKPDITGSNLRSYDVNGQLSEASDTAVGETGLKTAHYLNSSLDGLRARQDLNGQTSYLNVAGKTIGDLHFDSGGNTVLDVYSGFTPTGTAKFAFESGRKLSESVDKYSEAVNSGPLDGILPNIPQDNLGTWTLQVGDTLESIAMQVYGDSSLWYLIADANGITDRNAQAGEKGGQLHAGQQITIPPAASNQHHDSSTQIKLSSNDLMGNLTATVLFPLSPPVKTKRSPWKILGMVAIAALVAFATYMTAGVMGVLAGGGNLSSVGLGTIMSMGQSVLAGVSGTIANTAMSAAASFASGFVGSAIGQGVANLAKLQKGFDFTGALLAGVGAAVASAGLNKFITGNSMYKNLAEKTKNIAWFNMGSATSTMEQGIVSQGLNTAFHRQNHIDWKDIGISAVTAGVVGGKVGEGYSKRVNSIFKDYAPTVDHELRALAEGATAAMINGGHFNATEVLINNIGPALTDNFINNSTQEYHERLVEAEAVKEVKQEIELLGIDELVDGALKNARQEATKNYEYYGSDLISNVGDYLYGETYEAGIGQGPLSKKMIAGGKQNKIETTFHGTELLGVAGIEAYPDPYLFGPGQGMYSFGALTEIKIPFRIKSSSVNLDRDRFSLIQKQIFGEEGGVSNHPNDLGGFTNRGITFDTFKKFAESDLGVKPTLSNLRNLTIEQATIIYKNRYWDPLCGDEIESLSVTHVFYDFHVNSGQAVRLMQEAVNQLGGSLIVDNKMGPKTISEINKIDPRRLHELYKEKRINFYMDLVKIKPSQKVFEEGWIKRVNKIKYRSNDEWR